MNKVIECFGYSCGVVTSEADYYFSEDSSRTTAVLDDDNTNDTDVYRFDKTNQSRFDLESRLIDTDVRGYKMHLDRFDVRLLLDSSVLAQSFIENEDYAGDWNNGSGDLSVHGATTGTGGGGG
eukprot:Lankesteria_metandrocarpae@DN9640_c0_g1_i1.p1